MWKDEQHGEEMANFVAWSFSYKYYAYVFNINQECNTLVTVELLSKSDLASNYIIGDVQ